MKLSNLVGQALDGKYLIEKQLGKGGMGAVFFATHLGTERPVAVKVIMPQYMKHDEFVERFRREARAAGRLRHPNVVDVTDFGFAKVDEEEVAYLVMEYLDGCTLDEVLEEEGKLPFSFTLEILEQVCSAVEEAHQQGIIHRDLKPDNIWLEPNRRGSYTVKVLDFGIAKLEATSLDVEKTENDAVDMSSITGKFAVIEDDEGGTLLFDSKDNPSKPNSVAAYQVIEFTEGATQIQSAPVVTKVEDEEAEAETREMSIASLFNVAKSEDAGTKRLGKNSTDTHHTNTPSASALTRIGSVLGTPLYMSPEQCKGKTLDVRSDVYSLGVIAYQMLSGKTPFEGEYQEVMKAHIETEPPPLKVKGIRKKSRNTVMSALAKEPDKRPRSAAAFTSILRANSEGVGILFQRALTLFSRHLPSFLKLSLIVFAPLILITVLQVTNNILINNKAIHGILGVVVAGFLGLLSGIVGIITSAAFTAVTTWIVTSVNAAPLRPIEIRPAFVALRKRIKPFAWTVFLFGLILSFTIGVGIILLILTVTVKWLVGGIAAIIYLAVILLLWIISLVLVMARYLLASSVTLLEGLKGRAALRRSVELTRRSLRTVVATVLIQFAVPAILAWLGFFIISSVVSRFDPKTDAAKPATASTQNAAPNTNNSNEQTPNQEGNEGLTIQNDRKGFRFSTGDEEKRGGLVDNIFQIVWLPTQVLLSVFTAIVTGLLYLKTRQAGGESIKDVLEDFDDNKTPSKWRAKMRERLSLQTRTSKG